MENDCSEELALANHQIIAMLNSFVQVYHDVQIAVDQGRKQVMNLVQIYENVCNDFIGWINIFKSAQHWFLQMLGIFILILLWCLPYKCFPKCRHSNMIIWLKRALAKCQGVACVFNRGRSGLCPRLLGGAL